MVRGRQANGVSPERFLTIVKVTAGLLTLIIFTGAAVRLTESGLGCEDWPICDADQPVPEAALHPWIEFGNRLLSGIVALGCVAALVAAYRRVPRRDDLIRWSWYIVAVVAAQVIIGAITVKVELHPLFVSTHFLLSIVTLWQVMVLWFKASGGIGDPRPTLSPELLRHSLLSVFAATAVLVTGTVVTGTGPNSGDFRADRFNLDLEVAARIHSVTAWVFLAITVWLAVRLQRAGEPLRRVQPVIAVAVLQGAIGYVQFWAGVPAGMVFFHIVGAVSLWLVVLWMHLGSYERPVEVGGIAPSESTGEPRHEANFLHG